MDFLLSNDTRKLVSIKNQTKKRTVGIVKNRQTGKNGQIEQILGSIDTGKSHKHRKSRDNLQFNKKSAISMI